MSGRDVTIEGASVPLRGLLGVPNEARGVVLFAHGSGSGRLDSRNNFVARALQDARLATLLIDLLTEDEERIDKASGQLRFDIAFLAERLRTATEWLAQSADTRSSRIGYFGASAETAAALVAAAAMPDRVHAIVSRGGRPDLAGEHLAEVKAPTLLIVGSRNVPVIPLNKDALAQSCAAKSISRSFRVRRTSSRKRARSTSWRTLASAWFSKHLATTR